MTSPRAGTGAPPLSDALEGEDGLLSTTDTVSEALAQGRGRGAHQPLKIPPSGWWDVLRRVFARINEENVGVLAAGSAFYAMLAIFPALGAIVTLYAYVSDPSDVQALFDRVAGILPADVADIFNEQLTSLASREQQRLGLGVLVSVLFAVWSARRGVDALVRAVTVAYREREDRGFIRMNLLTYGLTLGAVMVILTTLTLLVILPTVIEWLPMSQLLTSLARAGSWVVFVIMIMTAIGVLYRLAPPRRPARWRWLSIGASTATLLWVVGSAGFSFYVASFGSYNETYGTLGAIIVLLLWFYLSAYAILLGAMINAELELQTVRDTTVGGPRPFGERGAVVADTLGKVAGEQG